MRFPVLLLPGALDLSCAEGRALCAHAASSVRIGRRFNIYVAWMRRGRILVCCEEIAPAVISEVAYNNSCVWYCMVGIINKTRTLIDDWPYSDDMSV